MSRLLFVPLLLMAFAGWAFSADKIPASSKGKVESITVTKPKKGKETLSDKALRASNIPQCENRCENSFKSCREKAENSFKQQRCQESKVKCQERCRRQYSQ